jgi:hypothetical protein
MDSTRFYASLAQSSPPADTPALLQALWHDAKGEWGRAHEIVQAQQGAAAARIHAYLHRKEGDAANAEYWYGRAGARRPDVDLPAEWQALVDRLLAGGGA